MTPRFLSRAARPARRLLPVVLVHVAAMAGAGTLDAQPTAPRPPAALVPADDPTYALLDELAALVPVRGMVAGQRPYSRREVVRLARSACAALAPADSAAGAERGDAHLARGRVLVATLLAAHAPAADTASGCSAAPPAPGALSGRVLESARLDLVAAATPPRPVPRDNGIGAIRAVTNPALDARAGRPAVEGAALSLETAHTLGAGGWLALVAQPRVSLVAASDGGTRWEGALQRLGARAVAWNVALHAGLETRHWGQGGERSFFLSGNAGPLRAVSIATDTAFALPWVLRHMGRWRAELLVADLGRDREFPHGKLAAYKLDLAVVPWLELGAGIMSQMGGRGAPATTTAQRLRDLAPYLFWIVDEGSDPLATNKVANAQMRLRIPPWRSATFAWEMAIDDFDLRRVRRMFWEDTGHLMTLSLPRLRDDGSLALDVQWHHTSLRLYQHYQFTDGLTYHGRIVGSPLGPAANAGYASLAWRPDVRTTWRVALAHEVRDSSQWRSRVTSVDEDGFDFVRTGGAGVREGRTRAALEGRRDVLGAGRGWFARAGLERVTNDGFVAGRAAAVRAFGEGGVRVGF
ncbi:MAG: capsule assembly Wzi family protein [Gemmatirosa sp.]